MSEAGSSPIPRATYRLQFHKEFGFRDATALAPYLARLGISHIYASPYLKARPGRPHVYDIVDHAQLSPELGDETAFDEMVTAFRDNGLGQILDFVPNHMGVGGADNPWWLDVLEWGPQSEYAGWFDIDWEPDRRYLEGKLLVPFLGDQYGAVLESGQLTLRFDPETGGFAVFAYDTHKLPICPLHYQRVLGDEHPELERLGDAFSGLPEWRPRIAQRAKDLQAELGALARQRSDVQQAVQAAVDRINGQPGYLVTWRRLDALIQDQYWRAAHFRVAADDINYRRFFNINELAGLRMELPELFDQVHRLAFELLRDGVLDGLRIDHIDGLLDPKGYLLRLREQAPRSFYLIVEKILARHEMPRTGQSRARPTTNSPIWSSAYWWIRSARRVLLNCIGLLLATMAPSTKSFVPVRSTPCSMRWRANSMFWPGTRRASQGRTRKPPTSHAIFCSAH